MRVRAYLRSCAHACVRKYFISESDDEFSRIQVTAIIYMVAQLFLSFGGCCGSGCGGDDGGGIVVVGGVIIRHECSGVVVVVRFE